MLVAYGKSNSYQLPPIFLKMKNLATRLKYIRFLEESCCSTASGAVSLVRCHHFPIEMACLTGDTMG